MCTTTVQTSSDTICQKSSMSHYIFFIKEACSFTSKKLSYLFHWTYKNQNNYRWKSIDTKWYMKYLIFAFLAIWNNKARTHLKECCIKNGSFFCSCLLLFLLSFLFFSYFISSPCFVSIADIDTHVWMCNVYDYSESWSSECLRII